MLSHLWGFWFVMGVDVVDVAGEGVGRGVDWWISWS